MLAFVKENETLEEHMKTRKFALYLKFENSRIRTPITCDEHIEFKINPLKTRRLRAIINTWRKEHDTTIEVDAMFEFLRNDFGIEVNGDEWPTIKVFTDDAGAIEWDLEHTLS